VRAIADNRHYVKNLAESIVDCRTIFCRLLIIPIIP
jgi:hypothetical protein